MEIAVQITWCVFLVLIGVNALIIVHELGHFLVARMCGVRCDKFYIWFDIYGLRFFRFKWGDTEYGLGILPLGGYVKMFGQEDNPGQIAKEIEKAKETAEQEKRDLRSRNDEQESRDLWPRNDEQTTDDRHQAAEQLKYLETALYAKDSYLSKSVPQRMAIISAGVIMNLIFAVICATAAYMIGFSKQPCAIGGIVPGSPAWAAGLQIGDRIKEADGKKLTQFPQIMDALIDGDSEKGVRMSIERHNEKGETERIEKVIVASKKQGALVPSIGIISHSLTNLRNGAPLSSSLRKQLPDDVVSLLNANGRLIAINDQPVESYADIVRLQESFVDQPLTYKFETTSVKVPAVPMMELGIRFQMGEITAVRRGSAAENAGIEPGDKIVEVGDLGPLDPLKLPQILAKKAIAEPDSMISVTFRKKGTETAETIELPLVVYHENLTIAQPHDSVAGSALGIAYNVENIIAGVAPDVSAMNIPVGAVVESIEFPDFVPELWISKTSFLKVHTNRVFWTKGLQFVEIGNRVQVPFIVDGLLQMVSEGTKVRLHTTYEGKPGIQEITVRKSNDWFQANRGFNFAPEEFVAKAESFGHAVQLGFDETVYATLAVYRFLKNIGRGVSAKAMGGPVTIVMVAYRFASQDFGIYLIFLCLIGANLAVLNILPIPVLDGGHLVFLAYEGIFRKPPNERVQIALSYLGLFLVLGLVVWTLSLDFEWISRF